MIEKSVRLLPIEEEIELKATVQYDSPAKRLQDELKEKQSRQTILLPRTQLRVGNMVQTAKEWNPDDSVKEWENHTDIIDAIHEDKIMTHEWGNTSNDSNVWFSDIRGIPLTDDLLISLFNFQHPPDYTHNERFYWDGRGLFHYSIWKTEDDKYLLANKSGGLLTPLRELKYIHELQNLYFASTNVEPIKTLPEHE